MIELREGLVDRIYEAAADSERWRSLLDEIAQLTRSRFGCLITGRSGECLALGPQEALAMLTEFRALRPRIPNPRLEFGLRATSPRYPINELKNGVEGTVVLRVLVDIDGKPLDVTIETSSGNRNLDRSALQHVLKTWRFKPAMQNGQAVQAYGLVPIAFNLQ